LPVVATIVVLMILLNLIVTILLWRHLDHDGSQIDALTQRVTRLETVLSHVPTEAQLSAIRENIAAIRERQDASADALQTIQKYLVERDSRGRALNHLHRSCVKIAAW